MVKSKCSEAAVVPASLALASGLFNQNALVVLTGLSDTLLKTVFAFSNVVFTIVLLCVVLV